MKNSTSRQFKASNVIRLALIDILNNKAKTLDVKFLSINITITNVDISSDLRIVKCFFVPSFGLNKLSIEDTLDTLEKNSYAIRAMVTSKIKLKYSPQIQFCYDKSFELTKQMEDLLNQL